MSRTIIVLVSLLLAACNLPSSVRQPSDQPQPGTVVVVAGESLSDVARRAGVATDDLARENRLLPPYRLTAGQVLRLPGVERYLVQPGDTLSGIASRLDVDMQQVARLNGLAPPYTIYVGQSLIVPGETGVAVAGAPGVPAGLSPAGPAWGAGAGQPVASQAPTSIGGPMALGQRRPSSTAVEVTTLPPLEPASPQTTDAELSEAPPPPPPAELPDFPPAPPPPAAVEDAGANDVPTQAADTGPAPGDGQIAAVPPAPPAASRQTGTTRFQWPVRGEIVSGYGAKPDGGFNEGVNIAAPSGAPVRAAGDGEVAYSGNELRGYGNLVLIRHDDGWITAYAHLDQLLVNRGQRVRAGETIATVGSSGSVSEPQLHFEVRQGTGAVDPSEFLPSP